MTLFINCNLLCHANIADILLFKKPLKFKVAQRFLHIIMSFHLTEIYMYVCISLYMGGIKLVRGYIFERGAVWALHIVLDMHVVQV